MSYYVPNYKQQDVLSNDYDVENPEGSGIYDKNNGCIFTTFGLENRTLNNITEFDCVFRTPSNIVIHKAGYTSDINEQLLSGNLKTKISEKYDLNDVLPEHWSNPELDNTTVIKPEDYEHFEKYIVTEINSDDYEQYHVQEKCVGHRLPFIQVSYNYDMINIGSVISSDYENHSDLINTIIDKLTESISVKLQSDKYKKIYQLNNLTADINVLSTTSGRPQLSGIIKQLKQINTCIGKLQENNQHQDMRMYDQFPHNNIEETEDNRKIQAELLNNMSNAVAFDMSDCICYSDCNGYSVCWCYGNCNHY